MPFLLHLISSGLEISILIIELVSIWCRESAAVQVHVTWEIATFCCLLQCICLEEMHISSLLMEHVLEVTVEPLTFLSSIFVVLHLCIFSILIFDSDSVYFWKAILFFGVESAIPVVGEAIKRKDLLKWAPKIWNLANGMGKSHKLAS